MGRNLLTAIVLGVLIHGTPRQIQADPWTDLSGHTSSLIPVAPGVHLEVLDWGGTGESLLLLAGLGDTAHVFDHFAHQLTDRFHVLGLTRRGFGASSQPDTGYTIGTLAQDIHTVLDSLRIPQLILIGHSLSGDEMTKFAVTYPNRVNALVYLDGAYDRFNRAELQATPFPDQPMTAADSASVERVNAYFARTRGWRLPEAEVRAIHLFGPDGRFVRETTPESVYTQIRQGLEPPAYRHIRVPALAIYAPDDLHRMFPNYESLDAADQAKTERWIDRFKVWRRASIAQFRAEMAQGRVVELECAEHYVFLTSESAVVREIRMFLLAREVPH